MPNRTIKNVHFYSSHIIFHTNVFSSLPLPPASALMLILGLWKQKRRGRNICSLSHYIRPSHCLSIEISNSASPRRWVLYIMYAAGLLACRHTGIIHPARTLCCEIFWWIKFANFDIVEDNVWKRPFMLLTPARYTTPIVAAEAYSNKFLTRPTRWDWLSQAQS